MKTIQIQSEYEGLFVAYQVWVYTKRGELPYGCPSMNKEYIARKRDEFNERAPFYCDIYDTTIYEAYTREITITL